jgi:hypothetical protein
VTCPIKKFCNARLKTKIVRSCLFKDPRWHLVSSTVDSESSNPKFRATKAIGLTWLLLNWSQIYVKLRCRTHCLLPSALSVFC